MVYALLVGMSIDPSPPVPLWPLYERLPNKSQTLMEQEINVYGI